MARPKKQNGQTTAAATPPAKPTTRKPRKRQSKAATKRRGAVTRAEFDKACSKGQTSMEGLTQLVEEISVRLVKLENRLGPSTDIGRIKTLLDSHSTLLANHDAAISRLASNPGEKFSKLLNQFDELIKTAVGKPEFQQLKEQLHRLSLIVDPQSYPAGSVMRGSHRGEPHDVMALPAKPCTVAVLRIPASDLLGISLTKPGQSFQTTRLNEHNPFYAVARMIGDGTLELQIKYDQ